MENLRHVCRPNNPSSTFAYDHLRITLTLKWSLTFQIVNIDTGGVQLQFKDYDPTKSYHTLDVKEDWELRGTPFKRFNPEDGENCRTMLDAHFKLIMANRIGDLVEKLQNQQKLYLPGAGVFFFKNGTFNSNGDFLTQVLWNGSEPPEVSAKARKAGMERQARENAARRRTAIKQAAHAVDAVRDSAMAAAERAKELMLKADTPDASEADKVKAEHAQVYAESLTEQATALTGKISTLEESERSRA